MPFRKSTRANIEAQRECIYTFGEGWGKGGEKERARLVRLEGKRALVKVPFGRDDKGREKARSRSSLNGTDEWLWKQHLICIEGERGLFVGSPWRAAAEERGEERNRRGNRRRVGAVAGTQPSLAVFAVKRALSLIYRLDRIFYSDCAASSRAAERTAANLFMIGHRRSYC